MPSTSRLAHAVRHRALPWRTRVDLLRSEIRRRARPSTAYALRVGPATVYLSDADYEIDWASFAFVFVDDAYAGDYRDAVVLDLGAHKGYYGAYALLRGARAVVSYEPESGNVAYLEKAAETLDRPGQWSVEHRAVGARNGEAELHVMGASWGHALEPPQAFEKHEVGLERVRVDALADVLADAVELAGGGPVVVKVNIEGAECPTVLETNVSAWSGIAELYVETHPWADCGAAELTGHLRGAGFTATASSHPAVLRMSRRP
jgi:FkbM family methyltransferase